MANQGQGELLPNHPVVHDDVHHQQQQQYQYHLLDAARALMLLGAAAAVSSTASTVYSTNPDDAAWVFFLLAFFVTWLLGVCLLSLVPLAAAAGRFPEADRFAGAAMASAGAVLRRFFIPWNY